VTIAQQELIMISRRQFLQAGAGALIAAGQRRSRDTVLGLVLPAAAGVPAEAVAMYPSGISFVSEALSKPGDPPLMGTLATYESLQDRIVPSAKSLTEKGAGAILLLATSVTFYKGAAHNQRLIDSIRSVSRIAGHDNEQRRGRRPQGCAGSAPRCCQRIYRRRQRAVANVPQAIRF
jgi:hypothetical protein